MTTYEALADPAEAAEAIFLPLADPLRRHQDPIRALTAARALRLMLEVAQESAVIQARKDGWSWTNIGESLGITRQSAHERYASYVDVIAPSDA